MTTTDERHINCAGCGQNLPESAYYKGRYRLCRECTKARYRRHYQANKDQRATSRQAWFDAHPDYKKQTNQQKEQGK